MTENRQRQDCPPPPKNPADQPNPCGGDEKCKPIETTTPPTLNVPDPCKVDPDCTCPKPTGPKPTCIDDLITKYQTQIDKATAATAFKTELENLLKAAKTADQDYTRDKYHGLVKAWVENDTNLAELVRKLVCAVPCWKCVLECYVCPVLNDAHIANEYLSRDTAMASSVSNIYDLQYWYTRDVALKRARLQRIQSVLRVWNGPAATIAQINTTNAQLIDAANRLLGTDPGKAVYDVFIKIIPPHLAVAPPAGSKWTTRIGKEYTEFCCCDTGTPDDCCGPDVGVLSFRDRLIGPLPYIIEPHELFTLICCLVQKRYAPAKEALDLANAALTAVNAQITSYQALVTPFDPGPTGPTVLAAWERSVRAAIPSAVDCCDYEKEGDGSPSSQSAM